MTESLKLHVTALSDRGLVRGNNEDSAYAGPYVLAMADGMGGHAAGEVASQLMIERISRLNQDPRDNDMLALLGASARDANVDIAKHVQAHPETEGMGTTLTAMMFNGEHFGVIHVGDSRAYRLRDGKLEQITKDDTFVQSLVDKGKLLPDDVSSHPQKSLILKAYTGRDVEPTLFTLDAKPTDRLLLCSDGLSDPVTASTIETALGQGSIDEAAQTLVELALRSGGPDNVTVVVAEVLPANPDEGTDGPTFAGAIAGELPEATRPSSSASRAAQLNRTPQVIPPVVPSTTRETMEEQEETSDEEEKPAPRKGWITVLSILAALILVVGGGLGAKAYISNTYYVAVTGTDEEIVIEKGIEFTAFGRSFHHTYQHACVNRAGELSLKSENCESKFQPLTVMDLAPADRQAVGNIDPGSYDAVQGELVNLTNSVLPVCLNRVEEKTTPRATAKPSASTKPSASATATPKSGQEAPKFRSEPGVNCREVK